MKLTAKTEQEMRESTVPWLDTFEELQQYIQSCMDAIQWPKQEDGSLEHATEESGNAYGRAVYAMSLASVATFQFVGRQIGASGFQASCAELDMLKRTRNLPGPFMILDASKLLYPQYNLMKDVQEFLGSDDMKKWLKEQAEKSLAEKDGVASSGVIEHWKKLVA